MIVTDLHSTLMGCPEPIAAPGAGGLRGAAAADADGLGDRPAADTEQHRRLDRFGARRLSGRVVLVRRGRRGAILVSGRGLASTIGGVSSGLALPAPSVSNRRAWVSTWLSKLPTIWL